MSDYLKFTPKGLFAYNWDGKIKKYIRSRPKKLNICAELRCKCLITKGTTLKDIFNAMDRYKLLKLFVSQYSWCRSIEEFHAQAKEPMRENDEDNLTYLELSHAPQIIKYGSKNYFDTFVDLSGVGPNPDKTKYGEKDFINWSVSYSPMWKIADLPVILNKEFVLYDGIKNKNELVRTTKDFTLLEILDGIYWDISFTGGPAENAKFLEEMEDKIESIENGTIETFPWENEEEDN